MPPQRSQHLFSLPQSPARSVYPSPQKRHKKGSVLNKNNHAAVSFVQRREIPTLPWKNLQRDYDWGPLGLHAEIRDFFQWIDPTSAELRMRQHVVDEVWKE